MNLTAKLKSWAVDAKLAKADDSDDTFKKAIAQALVGGTLSAEKFKELSATDADVESNSLKSLLQTLGNQFGELKSAIINPPTPAAAPPAVEPDPAKTVTPAPAATPPATKAVPTALEKMFMSVAIVNQGMVSDESGEKSLSIRVKEAAESYDATKTAAIYPTRTQKGMTHPHAGQPIKDWSGHALDTPSDLDKAVSGAYAKFLIQTAIMRSKNAAFASLPQHDKELVLYAMENMLWGGTTDKNAANGGDENIKRRKLTPNEQKALIDDGTSGGLEAAPIVFDDQAIMTPLLNGELAPMVNMVPIDRGRRIEGVQISNVTGSWGGVDDTAVSLFNTASFVTAFDTTIFRWEGAILIGLDFLSDTPLEFGQIITKQYGERLLEDLDDVIMSGNGTNQPEGITVKSGTTSVSFGGTTTIGGYESLRYGVPKSEHKGTAGKSAVFCGSETSYQRAKAIPVGASDARRLSDTQNMPDYDGYTWMQRPYKINESAGNTKIFYAIMSKYRMYRRRGLSMRQSTEGSTLLRANEMLIVAMARYGGHLERGAVAAVTSNAPA